MKPVTPLDTVENRLRELVAGRDSLHAYKRELEIKRAELDAEIERCESLLAHIKGVE